MKKNNCRWKKIYLSMKYRICRWTLKNCRWKKILMVIFFHRQFSIFFSSTKKLSMKYVATIYIVNLGLDLEIHFPRSKKILFEQNWSIIGRIWPWQCVNGICRRENWYLHVNDCQSLIDHFSVSRYFIIQTPAPFSPLKPQNEYFRKHIGYMKFILWTIPRRHTDCMIQC